MRPDEMPVPQADGVVTGRATSPPLFFCKIKKRKKKLRQELRLVVRWVKADYLIESKESHEDH